MNYSDFDAIPRGRYQIIYADPPWAYRDKALAGDRGAGCKYQVMSAAEIGRLPVAELAAPDCLLAMWHVPPQPREALELVEAWGFTLKTLKGFSWVKRTSGGLWHFGMGNYTRGNAEDCLFAVRGKPKRLSAGVRSLLAQGFDYSFADGLVHVIEAPRREHSRKPDEARDRLVDLMGDVPRIELFARQSAPGWDAFGNEIGEVASVDHDEIPF